MKYPGEFRRRCMLASMRFIMKSSFVAEDIGRLTTAPGMSKVMAAMGKKTGKGSNARQIQGRQSDNKRRGAKEDSGICFFIFACFAIFARRCVSRVGKTNQESTAAREACCGRRKTGDMSLLMEIVLHPAESGRSPLLPCSKPVPLAQDLCAFALNLLLPDFAADQGPPYENSISEPIADCAITPVS